MSDREPGQLAAYPKVLVGAEVADLLGLDPRNVAAAAAAGKLPAFKVHPHGEWRFDRRRIAAVIENRATGSFPPLLEGFPDVMSPRQVGEVLRYEARTVQQMAAAGTMPGGFKVGGPQARWRFSRAVLSKVIEQQPAPAAEPPPE
ncbi:helix-turn-helix domain-containing protein [Streptomyces sp. NPDC057199]|uniref:helix-turn-helix domain-containing protein n=1 Tax=Streptomyces sp. NPDC057199 TaxID=3346047 RepID=UPI00362E58C3